MQIFIAADHRGYSLKDKLVSHLSSTQVIDSQPVTVIDLGPRYYDKDDDYNDPGRAVAKAVLNEQGIHGKSGKREVFGILICGSAIGVSIQANRFKGIRAAVAQDIETAEVSREHDDANIICLSADRLTNAQDPLESEQAYEDIYAVVQAFLSTPFSGEEKRLRRIKRLDKEI